MSEPSRAITAKSQGLLVCPSCSLLCQAPNQTSAHTQAVASPASAPLCPRCQSALHMRKPHSIGHTWAFLLAGYLLYIPANLLPIMEARSLAEAQIDTIMSGVIYLFNSGSWGLAAIVFTASIVVPTFKLLALTWLNWTVQKKSTRWPQQRTTLYRFVELIGRWSMLDIFVVALLVALVQLRMFAVVRAGPAAAAFGAVVVLTMLAAHSFEPRLIWDYCDNE
ncbi:MAG: paraquat-inducible protein A [Burkholderiales bacterium]|nr:paraquat-inducible protein A [Burkholderiales bacterium]